MSKNVLNSKIEKGDTRKHSPEHVPKVLCVSLLYKSRSTRWTTSRSERSMYKDQESSTTATESNGNNEKNTIMRDSPNVEDKTFDSQEMDVDGCSGEREMRLCKRLGVYTTERKLRTVTSKKTSLRSKWMDKYGRRDLGPEDEEEKMTMVQTLN